MHSQETNPFSSDTNYMLHKNQVKSSLRQAAHGSDTSKMNCTLGTETGYNEEKLVLHTQA